MQQRDRQHHHRLHPPVDAADYVLLLDDDSDPDQILGEAGPYALTARGAATAPLAVLDVPSGYSNFGFFALNHEDPTSTTPSGQCSTGPSTASSPTRAR